MSTTAPSLGRGRIRLSGAVLALTVISILVVLPSSADARLYDVAEEQMLLGMSDRTAVSLDEEIGAHGRFDLDSAMESEGVGAVEYMAAAASEKEMKEVPEPEAKPAAQPSVSSSPAPAASASSSSSFKKALCTWYGPGLYGNRTADGTVLRTDSMVLAHRTLPFGTKVEVKYKGKSVIATVRDRGPKSTRFEFDLGPGVAKALGFSGVQSIEYRILK